MQNQPNNQPMQQPSAANTPVKPSLDGMDIGAVNLARAIRQKESGGNYEALGDGGYSAGAYQWNNGKQKLNPGEIPANFRSEAQQYGLNPDDFTPYNQDMVAYNKIKALKDQGYNVSQIASIWNSGDPDAWTGTFKNGKPSQGYNPTIGARYDVPAYEKEISNLYNQLKNSGEGNANGITATPRTGHNLDPYSVALVGAGLGAAGIAALPEEAIAGIAAFAEDIEISDAVQVVGQALGLGKKKQAPVENTENIVNDELHSQENQQEQELESEKDIEAARQRTAQFKQDLLGQLQNSAFGQKILQTDEGKDAIDLISQSGYEITNSNGRLNTLAGQDQIGKDQRELYENAGKTLDTEGSRASVLDWKNDMYKKIEEDEQIGTLEKDTARAIVDEMASNYTKKFGDGTGTMPLGTKGFWQIRKDEYRAYDTSETPLKNRVRRLVGRSANDIIKKNTQHSDLYDRVNKMQKKLIDAKKVLKKLDGAKAYGAEKSVLHKLFNATGEGIAVYIGSKIGGPWGAVIGEYFGEKIIASIDKNMGRKFFESKEGQAAIELMGKRNKKLVEQMMRLQRKYGFHHAQKQPLALPEPKIDGKINPDYYSTSSGKVATNLQEAVDEESANNLKKPQVGSTKGLLRDKILRRQVQKESLKNKSKELKTKISKKATKGLSKVTKKSLAVNS